MSIRLRTIDGARIAVCAARSVAKPGDVYLDDADHHALAQKFAEDFESEGLIQSSNVVTTQDAALRAAEESNNLARTWWDRTYRATNTPS